MKTTSPSLRLLPLVLVTSLAASCGGGGTAPPTALPQVEGSAFLEALVVQNDGQTTGLDGHAFTLVETGKTAVSTANGSLAFSSVPHGSLTLRLSDAYARNREAGQDGEDPGHDPDDAEHADRTEVHVERVQVGERIEMRIHLRGGEMCCVRISRQWRNEHDVEIVMEPTDANDDPDMEGELELEGNVHRQALGVGVEHADPGRVLELVVIDLDGGEESQGVCSTDDLGEAAWRLDTSSGDALPFAVLDLDALEGFGVEVRDATSGDALLTATVPEMPPSATGGGGSGSEDQDRSSGRALLTAVEPGLEGYVEIRSRNDGACESFQMEALELATGRAVAFRVEDPATAGSFLDLGTRTASGAKGKAHLGLSTAHGDVLPGDVDSVADLVGLGVEVRDADTDDLLLVGTVPELVAD